MDFLVGSEMYAVHYVDRRYSELHGGGRDGVRRAPVLEILLRLARVLSLVMADKVYVMPTTPLSRIERAIVLRANKSLVVDYYISVYDTLVNDRALVAADSRKARKLMEMDQFLIDAAEHLIFLSNAERDYYLRVADRQDAKSRTMVVPLCSERRPSACLPFANGKTDCITLCWWGTYIPLHGLEKILKAAVHHRDSRVVFELFVFGTSEALAQGHREFIAKNGLTSCVKIDNTKRLADGSLEKFLLERCDLAFGNFGDSEKAKTVCLNKAVEAASMGIPVISQRTAALAELFKEDEEIIFVAPSGSALSNEIGVLVKDTERLLRVGASARKRARREFSKERFLERMRAAL